VGTCGHEPLTLSSRSARRRLRSVQSLSKAAPTKKKRAKRAMTERLTGGAGSGWMTPSWVRSLETSGSSTCACKGAKGRASWSCSEKAGVEGEGLGGEASAAAALGTGRHRRRGRKE